MASEEAVKVVRGYFADLASFWLSERVRVVDTACGRTLVGRFEAADWPRLCMSAGSLVQPSSVRIVGQGRFVSADCVLVDAMGRQCAVAALCVVAAGEIVAMRLSHAPVAPAVAGAPIRSDVSGPPRAPHTAR